MKMTLNKFQWILLTWGWAALLFSFFTPVQEHKTYAALTALIILGINLLVYIVMCLTPKKT